MLPRIAVLLISLVHVYSLPHVHDANEPPVLASLPGSWSHPEGHPVARLFKRADGATTFPAVGSAEWASKYPTGPPEANIPALWTSALQKAVAAGKIPDIPQTSAEAPTSYPGLNANDPNICGNSCRHPDDIWDAPNGTVALSFDDGPLPAGPKLYSFLKANNQTATHFMIGSNILANPAVFTQAFADNKDDIAVHTWSHPHMCTRTNEQALAEIGWTLQIIHDSTGGRIPRYWRPPYGETDNRIRAIAKEVFGLTTVIWNQDTDDWNIGTNGSPTTSESAMANLEKWYAGPKSPGLMILEHELSDITVDLFIASYPLIKQNGWKAESIPAILGVPWYQNALDDTSPVAFMEVGGTVATIPPKTMPNATHTATPTPTPTPTSGAGTIIAPQWGIVTAAMTFMTLGLLL